MPTPTGTPTTTNLIQNGGFETSGSWTYAGQNSPARTTARAHSGSYSLQVGLSLGQQGDSITYQMVTVPSSATSVTLSFYYWPVSNDSSDDAVLQRVAHLIAETIEQLEQGLSLAEERA